MWAFFSCNALCLPILSFFLDLRFMMETLQFKRKDQITVIGDSLDNYLKDKSTDCVLYAKDGCKFKIHRKLFCQTDFQREILSSAKEQCCEILEILCPCSKDELNHLVLFLYAGVINCENELDSLNILENLGKVFGYQPKNLVRNNPNGTVFTNSTEIEDDSNAEEAFENVIDDGTNAKQVDEDMEITTKIENTTDNPSSKKVIQAVPIEDGPENILNSNYMTVVYDTEDVTLKEEILDCIPDDLNVSMDGNVNGIVIKPENSFDDPNVQKVSKYRRSLARVEKIIENTPDNPTLKKVVVIPLLGSKKQVSAKKERSKEKSRKKRKYQKKFKCNDCGASFVAKGNLKIHINAVHLKLKPHECDHCKKLFAQKPHMNAHIKEFHQKIKRHKCQECDKHFSRKYDLARHVKKVHLKLKTPKKVVCNECDANFEHKQHLEYHKNQVHLNIKPYECSFCGKASFKAQLKKHLTKSHRKEGK